MTGRDLGTGRVSQPVPKKLNPDYDESDGSAMYLVDEPHIGATKKNDPKPSSRQTGTVKGGSTNPTIGNSGDVERVDTTGDHG